MFNCSIVQDTVKSSHGVWKQSAECRSQDVTLRMGSNLLWCQFIICNILAACENLWFGAFFMWVGAVALQSPFMLKWIYQGTFHETHLGRALAAPRSPGSLVLAELASLGGQIGLGDLISWTLCQLSSPLNQTPPLVLVMFFFWSPSLWGAAWSSMVDLVGCHIREVLMGCIISLAEMLGFVRLVARAGFIR